MVGNKWAHIIIILFTVTRKNYKTTHQWGLLDQVISIVRVRGAVHLLSEKFNKKCLFRPHGYKIVYPSEYCIYFILPILKYSVPMFMNHEQISVRTTTMTNRSFILHAF
jgi:hypothetical protein